MNFPGQRILNLEMLGCKGLVFANMVQGLVSFVDITLNTEEGECRDKIIVGEHVLC